MTLLDIKETEGVDTAARLGARCLWPGETDITSEESVQAAIDATLQKFGKLSGAVNCAGIGMAMKVRILSFCLPFTTMLMSIRRRG